MTEPEPRWLSSHRDSFPTAGCQAWNTHAPLEYHKAGGGALSVGEDTHSVYKFVYKFGRKKVPNVSRYSRSKFPEHISEVIV